MKKITTLCILFLSFLSVAQENIYEFKDSNFKAYFPEKPLEQSQKVPTAVGELNVNMFMHQGTEEMYMISENQYPSDMVDYSDKEKVKAMLKGALEGGYNNMAAQSGATANIESQEYFMFKGKYEAIRGKAIVGGLYSENFIVLNGNKMYQVMCLGMGKYPDSKTAKKFANSFEIIETK